MSIPSLNLGDIRAVGQMLERVPNGRDTAILMNRLGLWTQEMHNSQGQRKPFRHKLSDLGPDDLSDEAGWWVSEQGRIMEILGLLSGVQGLLRTELTKARAGARSRARANWPKDQKAPAKHDLDDKAEEDPQVVELVNALSYVSLVIAAATAVRDATQNYRDTLSREISWRTGQMQGRM